MIEAISKIETTGVTSINDDFLNLDFFKEPESLPTGSFGLEEEKPKKKRAGRKKKETTGTAANMIKAKDEENISGDLPMYQTNEPYKQSYSETDNLLKGTLYQLDSLQNDIVQELNTIKQSKTLKGKYKYITDLTSASSNLLNSKISVIKEMNKVITDSHNLELKRIKDLKLNQKVDEGDDDKRIMDLYNAFISTPINTGAAPIAPSITDMSFMNGSGLIRADIGEVAQPTGGLTPIGNMMRLESNPDIKTVVVYDASTGNRWFDVMNVKTGESIPNVEKPDAMFLEDTSIDQRNRIARNTNLDITYDLIVINDQNLYQY